ncbi:MAG: hypothetical protein ACRD3F_11420 [Acidobacteriaceae bacterium]
MRVEWVRDGHQQVLGSKTVYDNGDTVARDRDGRVLGHSNAMFHNTRDRDGNLVRTDEADTDCLFGRR